MPTLADVAKIAGVGVMSVSRVVNGTRRVTPETERNVRAAIRRIGYEPNEAARILKGHRARIIGLRSAATTGALGQMQENLREPGSRCAA
jgi:LacI family transcriptional regulator